MVNYKVNKISNEHTVLEVETAKNGFDKVVVRNFNMNDKNTFAHFYNMCEIIEDGIVVVYKLPGYGTFDPITKPNKQEKCLKNLVYLFGHYCKVKDVENAEKVYNIVNIKAYYCDKVINNEIELKNVFSLKEFVEIDREYKKVLGKADRKIAEMEK